MLFTALKCIVTPVVSTVVGLLSVIGQPALEGKVWGKVEVSPAYIHLDVLEGGQTAQTIDMPAVRGDSTLVIGNGWCIKPTITYGKKDSELFTTGVGFGHCLPIGDKLILTPVIGYNYTALTTNVSFNWGPDGSIDFRERFHSHCPYAGVEVTFLICSNFRACANCYWGWSYTHTEIKTLIDDYDHSNGPNLGALLEYDFNKCWSINAGGAWNQSLGRTKDGIRAWGGKIGIARWF